jgi:hypothetical protein
MRPDALYFIILLCLTPDDFTRRERVLLLNVLILRRLRSRQNKRLSRDFNSLDAQSCEKSVNAPSHCAYESHSPRLTSVLLNMFMGLNTSQAHWLL